MWLVSAALLVSALGGGTLYDRVLTAGPAAPFAVVATPLSALLIALALLNVTWGPSTDDSRASKHARAALALSVAFLAWCAVSIFRSNYLHASLAVLGMLGTAVGAGISTFRAAAKASAVMWLCAALSGAASVVSVVGINEYLTELRGGNALWRVFAGFINPDFLAGYLVMAIPVSVVLLLAARNTACRTAAGAALSLQAACLVLTGSRLGLVTLVLALGFLGALILRGRLLAPSSRRLALVAVGLLTIGVVVAGRPLLRRLLSSGAESYSAQFRARTWRGAERMALANPILGTGIGTFETSYGPYAEVGYTQHAHNSYLQLAAETGMPGAILFVAILGIALWSGSGAAIRRPGDGNEPPEADTTSRLLAAGLSSALMAGALHNLSDSDLYVPSNSLTLGLLTGLVLRIARPDAAEPAHASRPWERAGASIVAIAIALQGIVVLAGRIPANGAELDSQAAVQPAGGGAPDPQLIRSSLEKAAQGFELAESRDPLNPEYPLKRASLLEAIGDRAGAEAETRKAVDRAGVGKTWYRLGKLLGREGRIGEAAAAHERARRIEPNNLDNLLALADACAATNRPAEAEAVWRRMVDLARSDYAKIRAVPEMVEWQYGRAYQLLGKAELQRGEYEAAAGHLKEAVGILGLFWKQRSLLIAQIRVRPDDRRRTADYYRESLAVYEKALRALGRGEAADAVKSEAGDFESERSAYESQGATASPP